MQWDFRYLNCSMSVEHSIMDIPYIRPLTRRPNGADWPTLVFEAGVFESLQKLKNDARWWLSNSGGQVKIVLIFSVQRESRTIQIERWENGPVTTRVNQPLAQVPTQVQQIIIDPNNVI